MPGRSVVHAFEREQDARKLATARDTAQRSRLGRGRGLIKQLDLLGASLAPALEAELVKRELEARTLHRKLGDGRRELLAERPGGIVTCGRKRDGGMTIRVFCLRDASADLFHALRRILCRLDCAPGGLPGREDLLHAGPKTPHEAVELVEALEGVFEQTRIGVDAMGVGAQVAREVLEVTHLAVKPRGELRRVRRQCPAGA